MDNSLGFNIQGGKGESKEENATEYVLRNKITKVFCGKKNLPVL
jgi:hypothetical protein